jgi:multidrug efflux pump subunit AcrA (membrane-fusion protein)
MERPTGRIETGMEVRRYFLRLSVLCITPCVLLSGCGDGAKSAQAQQARPPILVSVTEVKPENAPVYSEYPAQTFARDLVEVRGRVGGYIHPEAAVCGRLGCARGLGAL